MKVRNVTIDQVLATIQIKI